MSESPPRGKKRGCCSTQTSKTEDGRKVHMRLYPIQERRTGMARWLELEDRLSILKIGTKIKRTLHNNRSLGTSHLPLKTSEPMANPQCLSCVLLSPYHETKTHNPNLMKPPSDLIKSKEEYEIETITSHKKWGQGYWYLIKWKEYPISDNI